MKQPPDMHARCFGPAATLPLMLLLVFGNGCRETRSAPQPANALRGRRLDRAELLACLGAPPEAVYEPERLAGSPVPGLTVHTFGQETSSCGVVERRYVSYV